MKLVNAILTILFLVGASTAGDLIKLPVNSGTCSTIYGTPYPLEKSWDNNPATFFHAQSNNNGWAKYNIPESNVKLVRIQNRADCCEDRMTNNVVYVCTDEDDASCKECGRVTTRIGRSEWAEISCTGDSGLQGRFVKVSATNSYLQIAQIEIYADEIGSTGAETMKKLDVTSGTCSTIYGTPYPLEKSWDNNPGTFFCSQSNTNGWAKYNIAESNVKLVRLQNRADCCEERMTNNVVYVCADESDASCTECGRVTTRIARSGWAEITCNGMRGRAVKVESTNSYLQIAQIEIYSDGTVETTEAPATTTEAATTEAPTTTFTTTTTVPSTTTIPTITTTTDTPTAAPLPCEPQFADTEGQLEVASCTSMEVKDHTRACENMFDGSLSRDVKEGVCFVTKSNYKGWLEVKLAQISVVSKVVLLSKGNGENLAGTIVSVCMDVKKNCQRFGKIYKVKPDKCTILKGDLPMTGNMVRFYIADSSLAICELRIYGTPV